MLSPLLQRFLFVTVSFQSKKIAEKYISYLYGSDRGCCSYSSFVKFGPSCRLADFDFIEGDVFDADVKTDDLGPPLIIVIRLFGCLEVVDGEDDTDKEDIEVDGLRNTFLCQIKQKQSAVS